MEKNKLIIKMTNFEHNANIVCTVNFVDIWMREGFTATGYMAVNPAVSVMDIDPNTIPDNLYREGQ